MKYEVLVIERGNTLARIKHHEEALKRCVSDAEKRRVKKLIRNLNDKLTQLDEHIRLFEEG